MHLKAKFMKNEEDVHYILQRLGLVNADKDSEISINHYVVAPFGRDENALQFYEVLTPGELLRKYEFTGKKLLNGFSEIVRKESSIFEKE